MRREAVSTDERADERAPRPRLLPADAWLFDRPPEGPSIVGRGAQILAAPGEPTMLVGPEGVGKTTLAQAFALARAGVRSPELLGFPVAVDERPVAYIAADRPEQARRSLHRMVTTKDRAALRERLLVWSGRPDFELATEPEALARWATGVGVGTVVLDNLGALVLDMAKDETGGRVARALQDCAASGVEVLLLQHVRKSQGGRKPTRLDDSFGSRWVTAACGSVLMLDGKPGGRFADLRHLKQPAETVGPLRLVFDRASGGVLVQTETSLRELLRASPRGLTAKAAAEPLYGAAGRAEVERARRALDAEVHEGRAERVTGSTPTLYRPSESLR